MCITKRAKSGAGVVTQVMENLPSKHKALSSNSCTANTKKSKVGQRTEEILVKGNKVSIKQEGNVSRSIAQHGNDN
jgi:hypothetical protein